MAADTRPAYGYGFGFDRSLIMDIHAAPWLEANDWHAIDPEGPEDLWHQGSRIGPATELERSTSLDTSAGQYHDTMTVRPHPDRENNPEVGEPFGTWNGGGWRKPMELVLTRDAAGREVLVNDNGIVLTLE